MSKKLKMRKSKITSNKCYVCSHPIAFFKNGKETTVDGNKVCRDHLLSITRATMRSEIVYEYLEYGVEEANRIAKEKIPDTWLPEWWDNVTKEENNKQLSFFTF